jgi:hypothetical protein
MTWLRVQACRHSEQEHHRQGRFHQVTLAPQETWLCIVPQSDGESGNICNSV